MATSQMFWLTTICVHIPKQVTTFLFAYAHQIMGKKVVPFKVSTGMDNETLC